MSFVGIGVPVLHKELRMAAYLSDVPSSIVKTNTLVEERKEFNSVRFFLLYFPFIKPAKSSPITTGQK